MAEETPTTNLRRRIKELSVEQPDETLWEDIRDIAKQALDTVLAYSRITNTRPGGYKQLHFLGKVLSGEKSPSDPVDVESATPSTALSSNQEAAPPTRTDAIDAAEALQQFVDWTCQSFAWPGLVETVLAIRQSINDSPTDGEQALHSHPPPLPPKSPASKKSDGRQPSEKTRSPSSFWAPLDPHSKDLAKRLLARLADSYPLLAWNKGKAARILGVLLDEKNYVDRRRARAFFEGFETLEVVAGVLLLADRSVEDTKGVLRGKLDRVQRLTGVDRERVNRVEGEVEELLAREARARREVLVPGLGDEKMEVFFRRFEGLGGVDMEDEEEVVKVVREDGRKGPLAVMVVDVSSDESGADGIQSMAKKAFIANLKEKTTVKDVSADEMAATAQRIPTYLASAWGLDKKWTTEVQQIWSFASQHEPLAATPYKTLVYACAVLTSRLQNRPWSFEAFKVLLKSESQSHSEKYKELAETYAALYDNLAKEVSSGRTELDFRFCEDDDVRRLPEEGSQNGVLGRKRERDDQYDKFPINAVSQGQGNITLDTAEYKKLELDFLKRLIDVTKKELELEGLTDETRRKFTQDIKNLIQDVKRAGGPGFEVDGFSSSLGAEEIKPVPSGFFKNRRTPEENEELLRMWSGNRFNTKKRSTGFRSARVKLYLGEQKAPYRRTREASWRYARKPVLLHKTPPCGSPWERPSDPHNGEDDDTDMPDDDQAPTMPSETDEVQRLRTEQQQSRYQVNALNEQLRTRQNELQAACIGWNDATCLINTCQDQIDGYHEHAHQMRGRITMLEHERHQKDDLYNAAWEENARLTEVFNAQRQDRLSILANFFETNQERRRLEHELNRFRPQAEGVLEAQAARHEEVERYIEERNDAGYNYDHYGRDIDPPPLYAQDPRRVNLEGRRSPIANALAQANRRAQEAEQRIRAMAREQRLHRLRFEALERDNLELQEHTAGLERELNRYEVNRSSFDGADVPETNFGRFRRPHPIGLGDGFEANRSSLFGRPDVPEVTFGRSRRPSPTGLVPNDSFIPLGRPPLLNQLRRRSRSPVRPQSDRQREGSNQGSRPPRKRRRTPESPSSR